MGNCPGVLAPFQLIAMSDAEMGAVEYSRQSSVATTHLQVNGAPSRAVSATHPTGTRFPLSAHEPSTVWYRAIGRQTNPLATVAPYIVVAT